MCMEVTYSIVTFAMYRVHNNGFNAETLQFNENVLDFVDKNINSWLVLLLNLIRISRVTMRNDIFTNFLRKFS